MKTRLNDGRDLRCGAISGTQPGKVRTPAEIEREAKEELRLKMRAARASMGTERRRRSDYRPAPPTAEPEPVKEWDNPYLKKKTPKHELIHRARVRAARIKAASDPSNPVDEAAIIKRDESRCWICRKELDTNEIGFDHVIPLSRRGKHIPENVKVCCAPCNSWKGDRLVSII